MGHTLYEPSDFTTEELDRRNALAVAVCEGGLGVCKVCGATEAELNNHPNCASYRTHRGKED